MTGTVLTREDMAMDGGMASCGMDRLVAAEVFLIEAAFARPYGLSRKYGTMTVARSVLLRLTDADGVVGWGEANAMRPFTPESPEDVVEVLCRDLLPAVLGMTSPTPGRVDHALDRLVPGSLGAKGAVTMALLDIQGHRLGVPVSTLLGGALRDTIPVLWPLGTGSAEDDQRVIEERAPEGFASFMLKMGDAPISEEIGRVQALERLYGDRFTWIPDANQGWTIDEAREFLAGVEGCRIAFVEQPVAARDMEGMAELAAATAIPISADESLLGPRDAADLARLGAADVFSVKSSKNGGPLRSQRIVAVAEAFGINCYMNSMLEFGVTQAASLQHAATVGRLVDAGHAFMSTLRLAEDPTDFSTFVRSGTVHLPNIPGMGVRVDEDHVRRLAVSHRRVV